ncbi:MAG: hypothetical protein KatS3mg131_1978 [Candidatus Tectimicrobiota bacterium]|nr:MAG: hypothetical protein KatS3mg131_1978 [Candidatus Tectomicrobia bacterium]
MQEERVQVNPKKGRAEPAYKRPFDLTVLLLAHLLLFPLWLLLWTLIPLLIWLERTGGARLLPAEDGPWTNSPQVLSIWKGDMSLVGPRPPTSDEVEQYENYKAVNYGKADRSRSTVV